MAEDKYLQHKKLFFSAMIFFVLGLSLFIFAIYIVPYLVWGWNYDVPEFIFNWREWLRDTYDLSDKAAKRIIFLCILVPGIIIGIITHFIINNIEHKVLDEDFEEVEPVKKRLENTDLRNTVIFSLRLISLIVLVILVLFSIEWLLTVPTG